MEMQCHKKKMKDCYLYKGLLVLDKKRFYCQIEYERYCKIRAFIERRLITIYGVVYPRFNWMGEAMD